MIELIRTQIEGGMLVFPSILVLLLIFVYLIYRIVRSLMPRPATADTEEEFKKLLDDAGYTFDPSQNIFYSKMNPWQRKYGYCRLYDEAAVALGMIIDSEPVRFEYGGKRWLIEFWKGQYHLSTGCEIGVYYTEEPNLDIPGLFRGPFYQSVDNKNRLYLAYTLLKNGREVFRREGKHWWLTGFKPGEFSEPWELTMKVRIMLKDAAMCRSFVRALKGIGYQSREIFVDGVTVEFTFSHPHSPQPLTRTEETDWIIQRYNERICSHYQKITGDYESWPEKLRAIREQQPLLYQALFNIGKTRHVFKAFDRLKSYL